MKSFQKAAAGELCGNGVHPPSIAAAAQGSSLKPGRYHSSDNSCDFTSAEAADDDTHGLSSISDGMAGTLESSPSYRFLSSSAPSRRFSLLDSVRVRNMLLKPVHNVSSCTDIVMLSKGACPSEANE